MLETYALVLTGVFLMQLSPGPNLIAVAGAALGQGRMAGILVTLGVASAIFIWVTLMALGLAPVLEANKSLLTLMKFIGGSYLCYMGYKGLKAGLFGSKPTIRATNNKVSNWAAWRTGLLVNLTNPKSGLGWAAISTFMIGSGLNSYQVLMFAPLGALTATIIYGTYAVMFSSTIARKTYQRFANWFELAFGSAFALLGGRLILDGFKEIRT